MNFSLILPSRQRPALLRKLLESVRLSASNLDNVEVLVAVDGDDLSINSLPKQFFLPFPFCRLWVTERHSDLTSYYNDLARLATGRFIWALNDDCRIVTGGWDKLLHFRMDGAYYGRACYGRTYDTSNQPHSCFPILSRSAYEAQGHFFHPYFPGWGADQGLYRTWEALGRVVEVPVMVEHCSYHSGTRERDAVNESVSAMSRGETSGFFTDIMPGEIERISGKIV